MFAVVTSTGCVSAKYQRAADDTPPPTVLNLAATPAVSAGAPTAPSGLDARLNTVIVFRGPGSWKRDAYWDEYVLTLANRGAAPLVGSRYGGLGGLAIFPARSPTANRARVALV